MSTWFIYTMVKNYDNINEIYRLMDGHMNNILSEVSQTQKDKYHIMCLMWMVTLNV